jgi:CRISPR-associated endonuclease Csn1
VSFKQNLRVINQTKNKTWQWREEDGQLKKKLVPQEKGDSWAVRKPMHKETVSGKVTLRRKRKNPVSLNTALEMPELIADKQLKEIVKSAHKLYAKDLKKIKKHFKDNPIKQNGEPVIKLEVFEWIEATATRTVLSDKFTRKQMDSVTDTGIQKILENHLTNYTATDGKERFDLAFGIDGLEKLNQNLTMLNDGKPHAPIYKVRLYEEGSKFPISENGDSPKAKKYVEAAKGTNLFFAIYWDEEKEQRAYETIPLNVVIAHQKQVASLPKEQRTPVPINAEKGNFLFSLSPNDLVYVPIDEEMGNPQSVDFESLEKQQSQQIFKIVSSTGNRLYGVPFSVARTIYNKNEFTSLNKVESDDKNNSIKARCWKLKTDRLGNITNVIRAK